MIFKQGKNAPLVTPVAWMSRLSSHAVPCHTGGDWKKRVMMEKERESRLTAQLHRGHKGVAFLLQYTESREGWIDGYNRSIDR